MPLPIFEPLEAVEVDFFGGIDANDPPTPQYFVARAILMIVVELRELKRQLEITNRKLDKLEVIANEISFKEVR